MSFDTNQQGYSDLQIVFLTANDDRKIALGSATGTTDGIEIEYDRLTTPKTFKITPAGVNWNDGVSNHTTGLERLALVQTAFQAVELPPNATTLQVNNTILIEDLSGNLSISIDASGNSVMTATDNISLTANRCDIDTKADGVFSAGDINNLGSNTTIVLNDNIANIALKGGAIEINSQSGSTKLGDVSSGANKTRIEIDDSAGAGFPSILLTSSVGDISIGDNDGTGGGQVIQISNGGANVSIYASNGLYLPSSTIRYGSTLRTSNATLSVADTYAQTFNGTNLVVSLPEVDATNVGLQFLITNTDTTALTVNAVILSIGQYIYSTIGGATTSKTLTSGNSHIFTAIYTTVADDTFGWSMV
jgi:hypothetical protein